MPAKPLLHRSRATPLEEDAGGTSASSPVAGGLACCVAGRRPLLLLSFAWLVSRAAALTPLRIAGSSTVYPVAKEWGDQTASIYNLTIEGGGSSTGARRVCAPRDDPTHVDIGDMSRDWKSKEAVRLDDGYTLECKSSGIRVTQLEVGVDGLAVVVAKNSAGHNCLTNPNVRGLTLAQLRWIFSDWSNEDLATDGVNIASVVPNDDNDGAKEWSDLHADCPEVPINPYGAGDQSGTHDFFGEVVLCKDCFGDTEYFPSCSTTEIHDLEHMTSAEAATYITTQRTPNCYMPSEDDHKILQWTLADPGGVAYFGFAYYSIYAADLTVAQIASDKVLGTRDTTDAMIAPTSYTITDGSYTVFRRSLFMNVDNEAWPIVKAYMDFGFSPAGQLAVSSVGYVTVNTALRAKMIQRIVEMGNEQADYVPVQPERCWNGTRLMARPYVNAFGNDKIAYSCEPCEAGKYKDDNTPTECRLCASGRFTSEIGQSFCDLCEAGKAALEGSSVCSSCSPGKVAQASGLSSCLNCTAGSVSSQWGAERCEVCGLGEFAPPGSTACKNCSINTMAAAPQSGECIPCGEGTYAATTGSSRCDRCEAGKYRMAGSPDLCLTCPQGMTTAFMAATDPMDCKCAEGSYHAPGGRVAGPCLPCPEGMDCPFGSEYDNIALWESEGRPAGALTGSGVFPTAAEGYMTRVDDPMRVFACFMSSHCPGGVPGTCADLRDSTKPACGDCVDGSYEADDACNQCGSVDALPFVFTAIAAICAVIAMTVIINRDLLMQSRAQLMCVVMLSLTFTCMQTLGVFQSLSMVWFEPLKTAMAVLSLLSFDVRVVRLGCLPLSSNPVMSFFFRQTIAPLGVPIVGATLLIKKRLKPETSIAVDLMNTVGSLYQIFFMSIVVSATKPFICFPHPNNSGSSVIDSPSILCFEDDAHSALVAIGIISLFFVPVPFLVLTIYGIAQYPKLVRGGAGATGKVQLNSFRFMYFRFVPWRYYYSIVLLVRGLALCLVPVVIRGDVGLQIFVMGVIIAASVVVQQSLQPWRTESTNLLDAVMNVIMLMLLFLGALVSDVTASMHSIRILGSLIAGVFLTIVIVGIAVGVYLRFRPTPYYNMFLCHHKGHAAAQARLMKVLLQRRTNQTVFIDSDDLQELDKLFDTVKCKVGHLIVYLTKLTLTRPWCAGEICTAFHTGRPKVTAVWTPSFEPPSEEQLASMDTFLDLTSTKLSPYGMTLPQVADALRQLCSPGTNRIDLRTDLVGSSRFEALADELLGTRGKYSNKLTDIPVQTGMLAISADPSDDEAIAAANILADYVREDLISIMSEEIVILADYLPEDSKILETVSAARAVAVICSKDTLTCDAQLLAMAALMHNDSLALMEDGVQASKTEGAAVIPVNIPSFVFPNDLFYQSLSASFVFSDVEAAKRCIRSFFKRITISFPVDASEKIIKTQAREVASRVPKTSRQPRFALEMGPTKSFASTDDYGFVSQAREV